MAMALGPLFFFTWFDFDMLLFVEDVEEDAGVWRRCCSERRRWKWTTVLEVNGDDGGGEEAGVVNDGVSGGEEWRPCVDEERRLVFPVVEVVSDGPRVPMVVEGEERRLEEWRPWEMMAIDTVVKNDGDGSLRNDGDE